MTPWSHWSQSDPPCTLQPPPASHHHSCQRNSRSMGPYTTSSYTKCSVKNIFSIMDITNNVWCAFQFWHLIIWLRVVVAENVHPCCSVVGLGGGWLGTRHLCSAVTSQLLLSSEAVLGGATSPPAGITLESRAQCRAHIELIRAH